MNTLVHFVWSYFVLFPPAPSVERMWFVDLRRQDKLKAFLAEIPHDHLVLCFQCSFYPETNQTGPPPCECFNTSFHCV